MFKFLDRLFLLLCICCVQAQVQVQAQTYPTTEKKSAQAQTKMPNRHGMSIAHGMFDVKGKGDVTSQACMNDCPVNEQSLVVLPTSVNGLNGNLAEQNRSYGLVRGVDTSVKR